MICNTDGALFVFRRPIIEALLAAGHEVCSISGRSDYFQRLEELGVQASELDFHRHSASPVSNIRLFIDLFLAVRRNKPDIVHCFTHKPAIYGTLGARFGGCRNVYVTITGLGTLFVRQDWRSRILRQLLLVQYRLALPLVRNVFFQNSDDMMLFCEKRIASRSKAILTYGSGIDLEQFALPSLDDVGRSRRLISRELGIETDECRIVILPARAVREKGVLEYYGAAEKINLTHPGRYVFLHAGMIDSESSGELSQASLESLAQRSGVRYLGFKSNIAEFIRGADIVALPSYREGSPRAILEALAFGKAIVTTNAPGCRETVEVGVNGVLCEVGDVDSLANALLSIDESVLERARSRSREICEAKFDSASVVELTLSRYFSKL